MESEPYPEINRLEARGHWGIKRGLENPRRLLALLDRPDRHFSVVLIAGTNGKGSTGAFLSYALRAAGLKVGWTTSPHLVSPTERIWIDGTAIEASELNALLAEVFEAEEKAGIQATYFELMIASAILAFQKHGIHIAIVEAGLGGRWDATNALDPALTVLTNVGLDHTQYLGPDIASIAREKLCTARHGRPLVLGPGLDPAWIWPLLECRPILHPAPLLVAEQIVWDHSFVQGHRIGLAGQHQIQNLSTAMEALRQLNSLGFSPSEEALWRGIGHTLWPGRFWAIPGLEAVWADGAHNPDGARVLAAHVRTCGVHPHLIFGVMGDKDIPSMVEALKSMNPASITLVRGENERYASKERLQEVWGKQHAVLDLTEAAALLQRSATGPRLVTGSLFFIGDILRILGITPHP